MKPLNLFIISFFYSGLGYWMRGFFDKRRDKRRVPYRAIWKCPQCKFEISTSSNKDPIWAINFLERMKAEHIHKEEQ